MWQQPPPTVLISPKNPNVPIPPWDILVLWGGFDGKNATRHYFLGGEPHTTNCPHGFRVDFLKINLSASSQQPPPMRGSTPRLLANHSWIYEYSCYFGYFQARESNTFLASLQRSPVSRSNIPRTGKRQHAKYFGTKKQKIRAESCRSSFT